MAHQKQTKGVLDIGIARIECHRLAQQLGTLLIHAAHTMEIRKIDHGRNESWVEAQRRPIFLLGFGELLPTHVQQPQIEMRLGPLGIDHLGGDELRCGFDQRCLLRGCQRQQVGSGQCPSRFDTDGSNRIAEKGSERFNDCGRRGGRQGTRRR